jgi:hypothetical protein
MLATDAKTFLRIGYARKFGDLIAQKSIFKLVHPRVGKHQGRVIFDHYGGRRNVLVLLGLEKFNKGASDFFGFHGRYAVQWLRIG